MKTTCHLICFIHVQSAQLTQETDIKKVMQNIIHFMKAVSANEPKSFYALLIDQGLPTIRKSTVEFKYKRIYLSLFCYIVVYAPSKFKV
jgi:hypothetical protein